MGWNNQSNIVMENINDDDDEDVIVDVSFVWVL